MALASSVVFHNHIKLLIKLISALLASCQAFQYPCMGYRLSLPFMVAEASLVKENYNATVYNGEEPHMGVMVRGSTYFLNSICRLVPCQCPHHPTPSQFVPLHTT